MEELLDTWSQEISWSPVGVLEEPEPEGFGLNREYFSTYEAEEASDFGEDQSDDTDFALAETNEEIEEKRTARRRKEEARIWNL